MGPLGGRGAACSEHVELGAAARRVRYGAGALELGEYFLGIARADGGLTCNRSSRSVRCARLSPHPAPRVVPQNALAYNLSCFASWISRFPRSRTMISLLLSPMRHQALKHGLLYSGVLVKQSTLGAPAFRCPSVQRRLEGLWSVTGVLDSLKFSEPSRLNPIAGPERQRLYARVERSTEQWDGGAVAICGVY